MFGQTFELLPQHRILCCNADRAGIEMTLSHHDASHSNQWCLTVGGRGRKGCLQGGKKSRIQIRQAGFDLMIFITLKNFRNLWECIHPRKITCPLKRDFFSRKYRGHVSFAGEYSLDSWITESPSKHVMLLPEKKTWLLWTHVNLDSFLTSD